MLRSLVEAMAVSTVRPEALEGEKVPSNARLRERVVMASETLADASTPVLT